MRRSWQALTAGQIDAHLTSPPFQQQAADEGAHDLLNSYDLFGGEHTFNGVYAMEELVDCRPEAPKALLQTLDEANARIEKDPAASAETLSKEIGGIEPDAIQRELEGEGTQFTERPINVTAFADFMHDEGMFFDNSATKEGN